MADGALCYKTRHALSLLSSINELKKDEIGCDFTINVGASQYRVHRTILSACSKYFKAMLSHNMKESREGVVVMKDISAKAVQKCIEFMYTGESELELGEVKEVLHSAGLMQLHILSDICFQFLGSTLSAESAFFAKDIAQLYSCDNLQQMCEDFIEANFEEVIRTEDFLHLRGDEILNYTTSMNVEYEVLWQAIVNWTEYDRHERNVFFLKMLKVLCGKVQTLRFLLLFVWKESLVHSSKECINIVCERLFRDLKELKQTIDLETCFVLKDIVGKYAKGDNSFGDDVICYIAGNFEHLYDTEEWKDLAKEDILLILQSPHVVCSSETVKWSAILTWTKHERRRKRQFEDLLLTMNFDLLPVDFISDKIRSESLIRESTMCMGLVMDALANKVQRQSLEQRPVLDLPVVAQGHGPQEVFRETDGAEPAIVERLGQSSTGMIAQGDPMRKSDLEKPIQTRIETSMSKRGTRENNESATSGSTATAITPHTAFSTRHFPHAHRNPPHHRPPPPPHHHYRQNPRSHHLCLSPDRGYRRRGDLRMHHHHGRGQRGRGHNWHGIMRSVTRQNAGREYGAYPDAPRENEDWFSWDNDITNP